MRAKFRAHTMTGRPRRDPDFHHSLDGQGGHCLRPTIFVLQRTATTCTTCEAAHRDTASSSWPRTSAGIGYSPVWGDALPPLARGRSWRIPVTIAPIGYVGEFRKSRVTGRWLTGKHTAHVLGVEAGYPPANRLLKRGRAGRSQPSVRWSLNLALGCSHHQPALGNHEAFTAR